MAKTNRPVGPKLPRVSLSYDDLLLVSAHLRLGSTPEQLLEAIPELKTIEIAAAMKLDRVNALLSSSTENYMFVPFIRRIHL